VSLASMDIGVSSKALGPGLHRHPCITVANTPTLAVAPPALSSGLRFDV
jgi:hypothetical protein